MLRAMNRGYTVGEYLEFIDRARHHLHQPEIGRPLTIAGDIIVGFPGETEEDFLATADLLRRVRYKNCFIFKYSPRPGTVAHERLTDDVPDPVKRRRNNDLLSLQAQISDEVSREYVGSELDVFVQSLSKRQSRRQRQPGALAANENRSLIRLTVSAADAHSRPSDQSPRDDQGCCATHEQIEHSGPSEPEDHPQPVQMSARSDGDLIVFFDAPPGTPPDALIGSIVRVRVESASGLALHARTV
jgi:tRNA-2-methylthio-N6-dimethylallyladenosine synthase